MSKDDTKNTIIQALRNLSERLGRTSLSKIDVKTHLKGIASETTISYHFGNLGNALEAAGLERFDREAHNRALSDKSRVSDETLFQSLIEVERTLGHERGVGPLQEMEG